MWDNPRNIISAITAAKNQAYLERESAKVPQKQHHPLRNMRKHCSMLFAGCLVGQKKRLREFNAAIGYAALLLL
jgi:hypothetical protein